MKKYLSEELIRNRLEELDALNSKKYEPISFLTMAELYSDVFKDYLCYNQDWGIPMEFDGVKWQVCKNLSVWTSTFTKALIQYTAGYRTPLAEFAFNLTKPSKARQLETQFKSLLESNVNLEDFDSNPFLINAQNGVIDLKTGELKPTSGASKFLKSVNADYDPTIDGENRWTKFVLEIMSGDKSKAEFLQRVLGYSLIGTKREDKFWIFHGETTRNGKSTLMSAVLNVLDNYGCTAQHETFCETYASRTSSGPSSDIARLSGARLCHVPEPKQHMALDVAKIKQLTGNDSITARFLNKNEFEFIPQFSLIFTTNHLPAINDETIFKSDRVVVIPFEKHFSAEEQDETLRDLFKTNEYKSIILKWLVTGARKYLINRFNNVPEAVKSATERYKVASDTVNYFVTTRLVRKEETLLPAADAYIAYLDFCEMNRLTPVGKQSFVKYFKDKDLIIGTKRIGDRIFSNVIIGYKVA